MHKSFPFQCIFSASLSTFRKGVHCTKALHPLTRAVRVVQCTVCFSTLYASSSWSQPKKKTSVFFSSGGMLARRVSFLTRAPPVTF